MEQGELAQLRQAIALMEKEQNHLNEKILRIVRAVEGNGKSSVGEELTRIRGEIKALQRDQKNLWDALESRQDRVANRWQGLWPTVIGASMGGIITYLILLLTGGVNL